MPMYDFKCEKCQGTWTILISMPEYSYAEEFECANCGHANTKDARINIGAGLSTTIIGARKPRSKDMW